MIKNAAPGFSSADEMLKLYQDLVETSQDLTWQCDVQGRYTYLNPAWETAFGYKLAEMRGRKFSDFQSPDMARRDMREFSLLVRGGSLKEYETTYLAKSGEEIHLLMNSKCIRDDAGDIIGTRGTAHDITERKKTEEAFRENEQNYRSLADSGQALIWVAGTDKLCNYFNRVWLKFTGRSLAQEMGNGWAEGVHADDLQRCLDIYIAAFDRREKFSMEYRLLRYDGEYRWILDDGSPRYNSIGEFIGYIGHCLDITDRIRVEESLISERNLLLTMINTIPDRVYVKDRECRFLLNNTAHLHALGAQSQADAAGKTDHDYRKLELADDLLADDRHVIQTGEAIYNSEESTLLPTGETGTILVNKVPFRDSKGDVIGLVGVSRDITEVRQIEARMRQSERMDAIGQLAGGIAHDFNNVLGGIIGYTDMSLALVEKNSLIEQNLRKILKASDRAAHLVQQILAFSRTGNQQKSVASVGPIVKEVLELLRASIPSSVIIESDLQKNTKPVLADPRRLHEVLLNLASNAVHAMNRKGTLTVRLSPASLNHVEYGRSGAITPGEYAVIEVADTGCGMDVATQVKAFEPFFTTKAVGEGTGMGLSVVLGIVQSHGGDIRMESEVGKGTTFRVYLPAAGEVEVPDGEADATVCLKGNERILFVDDELMMVEMVKDRLTHLGYAVTAMTESPAALAFLRERGNEVDVLITDQTMPVMTGIELAKEALKMYKNLPIILCTGFSSEVNPERVAAIGIRKFVMKPFRSHELCKAVRDVLDNKITELTDGDNLGH